MYICYVLRNGFRFRSLHNINRIITFAFIAQRDISIGPSRVESVRQDYINPLRMAGNRSPKYNGALTRTHTCSHTEIYTHIRS